MPIRRRRALKAVGLAATGGLAAVAGCPDGGAGTPEPELIETEPNYRGWFDGVSNYRGTVDYRDSERVRVRVGVSGDLGFYRYGPPAVAVSPGTSVVWEWTGRGGAHDVVAERGGFDSGDPVRSETETFTYTFEAPAVYPYYCTPHREQGMRGAVFVALDS
ncbi:halocyanin domain-containing protein [Halosimplex halophilum]|uniref:halocyanin domain-containing protein n=1 Tax=Halosimplex halophilum TaxID=2559572 RepID=UPI00107F4070|nr:halocyanin domain-containing protein [Halosimplex halophilum]